MQPQIIVIKVKITSWLGVMAAVRFSIASKRGGSNARIGPQRALCEIILRGMDLYLLYLVAKFRSETCVAEFLCYSAPG